MVARICIVIGIVLMLVAFSDRQAERFPVPQAEFTWAVPTTPDIDQVKEAVRREIERQPIEVECARWVQQCFGDHCELKWVPDLPSRRQVFVTPTPERQVVESAVVQEVVTTDSDQATETVVLQDASSPTVSYGSTGSYGVASTYGSSGGYGTSVTPLATAPVVFRSYPVAAGVEQVVSYEYTTHATYAPRAAYSERRRPIARIVSFPFRVVRAVMCRRCR